MPGASAIGYFANPPMRKLPNAAERHVAAVTAPSGIPASARIDGFTKMMYGIVRLWNTRKLLKVNRSAESWTRQLRLPGLRVLDHWEKMGQQPSDPVASLFYLQYPHDHG